MQLPFKAAAAAVAIAGAAMVAAAPAQAQVGIHIGVPGVHVGVHVGGPAPAYYYGPGYYPPGPCDAYTTYYEGDCGYAVYTGPIIVDGVSIGGPHYYRWWGDRPYFWYRGGWHTWDGWARVGFRWDHREGWGWHNGHWDRDWGRAHWHPRDR